MCVGAAENIAPDKTRNFYVTTVDGTTGHFIEAIVPDR
jgi:hypothetical protein